MLLSIATKKEIIIAILTIVSCVVFLGGGSIAFALIYTKRRDKGKMIGIPKKS